MLVLQHGALGEVAKRPAIAAARNTRRSPHRTHARVGAIALVTTDVILAASAE